MTNASPLAFTVLVLSCLPTFGCGLLSRGRNTTNVSSNIEINQQGRDVATLKRSQYEVIDTSIGEDKAASFFLLTIPVGKQTSKEESVGSAHYNAVDRIPECDALMMPRVDVKRTIIPLLLVNIVVRKTRVKGRCINIKDEVVADDDTIVGNDASVAETQPAPGT